MASAFDLHKDELLDLISEAVNLKNLDRAAVTADTPIMADGLGLDSIDILEVVIALEKKYNLKIENDENSRMIFRNLGLVAEFVNKNKTERPIPLAL
jgi:acyl carrier protein